MVTGIAGERESARSNIAGPWLERRPTEQRNQCHGSVSLGVIIRETSGYA